MKLENYLEQDLKVTHKYQDESIISNLYLTSIPMSLRELDSRGDGIRREENAGKRERMQRNYQEEVKKQNWLSEDCDEIYKVKTLSLDQLKKRIDDKKKSCDAYFYYPNTEDNKRNLMIEFKNVNKSKIIEYIKRDDKDGLWCKVMDSVSLLRESIGFEGYNDEQIISNTHLMIVYGERADTVSAMHMNLGSKKSVSKDKCGRQNSAVRFDRQYEKEYSIKETKEILDKFSDKIKAKGLAACPKGYFGVPIREPDQDKSGKDKVCWYTLYSKKDFQKVVGDEGFFENWDWGIYSKYLGKK